MTTTTTTTTATPALTHANEGSLIKRCTCPEERQTKCRHPWTFTVRRGTEKRIWISLAKYLKARKDPRKVSTKGEANAIANEIRAAVFNGTFNPKALGLAAGVVTRDAEPSVEGKTIADAAALVMGKLAGLTSATQERHRYNVIERLTLDGSAPFGTWLLATIGEREVEAVYAALTGAYSNSNKRKYRRALKRLFRAASKAGWIAKSPITEETNLRAGVCAVRDERITPEYEAALIKAAKTLGTSGALLADFIVCAIESGARSGEILAIQVRDVRLAEGLLVIAAREAGASKSGIGKGRIVPISERLDTLLRTRIENGGTPLGPTAYVFGHCGVRVRTLQRVWENALLVADGYTPRYDTAELTRTTAAGKNFSPKTRARLAVINKNKHDLRHEAALRWHYGTATGFTRPLELAAIAELLGHADLAQLRVYLGIKNDDAIAAFRRASGTVIRAVAGKAPRARKGRAA